MPPLTLRWLRFGEFTTPELYAVLELRQRVFVIEQASLFADIDGRDREADHLLACGDDGALHGYLRVFAPGIVGEAASLGRVVVGENARGTGLGRDLVAEGLAFLARRHPDAAVAISAQEHLQRFYGAFGFETVSAPYDDAGIPHVDMVLQRRTA
ncbi:GNAT family N-acetyltransferase [Azospirillum sp.]|uniref:GNAT family N-acetyltransferase n=1 Tax=Azospirillum sp. TaxID=34012 RepID=UPI003D74C7DC